MFGHLECGSRFCGEEKVGEYPEFQAQADRSGARFGPVWVSRA